MNPLTLILTAANRAQARGYLMQLRQRERDDQLPGVQRFLVVPDPTPRSPGARVGSGTATLLALRALIARLRREWPHASLTIERALANRRVILIHSGGDSRRLPAYAAQGKIFAPLPADSARRDRFGVESHTLFDAVLADLASIEFPESGGVLVASGDVLLGMAQHRLRFEAEGVQCVAAPGDLARASRHGVFVRDDDGFAACVLQKPTEAALRSIPGALDSGDRALVDLGLVFLPPREAARWLRAAEETIPGHGDNAPPAIDLYSDMLPALLAPPASAATAAARLLRAIASTPLRIHTVPDSQFLHIGSSRELLDHLSTDSDEPCVLASVVPSGARIAPRCVIDSCEFSKPPHLSGENILVNLPGECDAPIDLPPRAGLVCLPIDDRDWAAIAFGVDDDFKTAVERGATFMNRPLSRLPGRHWRDIDDRTLWAARLWRVGDATEVVAHALAALSGEVDGSLQDEFASASMIMSRVNHRRLLAHRQAMLKQAAFDAVARSVRVHVERLAIAAVPHATTSMRAYARATAPVRVDLAGGWSDTPPICNDVGGCVVNVAVKLDGAHPISAEVRRIDEPLIRIASVDLAKSMEIRDAASLHDHRDPGDWAALPKAALTLAGFAPDEPDGSLREWLESRGVSGGLALTISSDLPKGSGLGASSILGATTLAALAHFRGETPSRETLIARTSALEQMMSTAGGWQDQAGGITGGAKFLETAPDSIQVPAETSLRIPADFWRERVLLYSTGLQRLARDILQNVVWRWITSGTPRNRVVRTIVDCLRENARAMRDDLQAGDLERFSKGLQEYWMLKRMIDPGATTPTIERMIDDVKPWLSACELPGAGGGGFLFMIARDADAASRIRRHFATSPPNANARFFEARIDAPGLDVSHQSRND